MKTREQINDEIKKGWPDLLHKHEASVAILLFILDVVVDIRDSLITKKPAKAPKVK